MSIEAPLVTILPEATNTSELANSPSLKPIDSLAKDSEEILNATLDATPITADVSPDSHHHDIPSLELKDTIQLSVNDTTAEHVHEHIGKDVSNIEESNGHIDATGELDAEKDNGIVAEDLPEVTPSVLDHDKTGSEDTAVESIADDSSTDVDAAAVEPVIKAFDKEEIPTDEPASEVTNTQAESPAVDEIKPSEGALPSHAHEELAKPILEEQALPHEIDQEEDKPSIPVADPVLETIPVELEHSTDSISADAEGQPLPTNQETEPVQPAEPIVEPVSEPAQETLLAAEPNVSEDVAEIPQPVVPESTTANAEPSDSSAVESVADRAELIAESKLDIVDDHEVDSGALNTEVTHSPEPSSHAESSDAIPEQQNEDTAIVDDEIKVSQEAENDEAQLPEPAAASPAVEEPASVEEPSEVIPEPTAEDPEVSEVSAEPVVTEQEVAEPIEDSLSKSTKPDAIPVEQTELASEAIEEPIAATSDLAPVDRVATVEEQIPAEIEAEPKQVADEPKAEESAGKAESADHVIEPAEEEIVVHQTNSLVETSPDAQPLDSAEPIVVQDEPTPAAVSKETIEEQKVTPEEAAPEPEPVSTQSDTAVNSPPALEVEAEDNTPLEKAEPVESESAVAPEEPVRDVTPAAQDLEIESSPAPAVEEVAPEPAGEPVIAHEDVAEPDQPALELSSKATEVPGEVPEFKVDERTSEEPISAQDSNTEVFDTKPESAFEDTSVATEPDAEEPRQEPKDEIAGDSDGDAIPTFAEPKVDFEETPSEESLPEEAREDAASPSLELPQDAEERPKSPWTPSYSVISQGGASLANDQEVEELEQLPPPVTEDVAITESVESAAEPEPVVESLDVAEIPIEESQAPPVVEVTEDSAEPTETTSTFQADTSALVVDTDVEVEERPKSPWTPSYSVTTLPGSPRIPAQSEPEQPANEDEKVVSDRAVEETTISDPLPSVEDAPLPTPEHDALPAEATEQEPAEPVIQEPVEESFDEPVSEQVVVESFDDSETTHASAEVDYEALGPDTDGSQAERPWTPSYSVTTLPGSPRVFTSSEVEEHQPSLSTSEQFVEETTVDTPKIEDEVVIAAVPTETLLVDSHVAPDSEVLEEEVTLEPSVVEPQESPASEPVTVETEVDALSPTDNSVVEERPRSPWTPSYSVTTLPGSNVQETTSKEVVENQVAPILITTAPDEPAAEASDKQSAEDEILPSPLTSVDATESTLVESEQEAQEHNKLDTVKEIPERPWTPSYSSYTQGPGASTEMDDDKDSINSEPFEPQIDIPVQIEDVGNDEAGEDADSESEEQLPVGAGDATPKEFPKLQESLDTLPDKSALESLQTADPAASGTSAGRSRYESTTSSRFFPGAWFSSTPKSPQDEGRASLEAAIGEFVPAKSTVSAPKEPTVEETSEEEHKPEERKARWCTIM